MTDIANLPNYDTNIQDVLFFNILMLIGFALITILFFIIII
jgi:hypothetical protein